jgi:hypothetical protein
MRMICKDDVTTKDVNLAEKVNGPDVATRKGKEIIA